MEFGARLVEAREAGDGDEVLVRQGERRIDCHKRVAIQLVRVLGQRQRPRVPPHVDGACQVEPAAEAHLQQRHALW